MITHPCRFCGEQVYTVSRMSTKGWLVILLGFLACGVGILPAWIIAETFFREVRVECDTCGVQ